MVMSIMLVMMISFIHEEEEGDKCNDDDYDNHYHHHDSINNDDDNNGANTDNNRGFTLHAFCHCGCLQYVYKDIDTQQTGGNCTTVTMSVCLMPVDHQIHQLGMCHKCVVHPVSQYFIMSVSCHCVIHQL